ncbi:MAG: iron-containing alcohol dehydrogenase [Desulfurivibrionaceae bacterium]
MFDFTFHNPTKIIFGAGKEALIGSELSGAGITRVLLVHGRNSVVSSGLLDRVMASLGQSGIACTLFGGVVSNPILSHTREGVVLAKRNQVEAILAVGGGSVLDESKAIAVGALSDSDVWQFFVGKEVERALPIFTILTIAATGSEMNGNSVVTNAETRQKYNISSPHVYPRVSILNPELTHSVPLDYTAYGAVDAIAHVCEGYFTKQPGTHLQDRLVEGIIKTVIETTTLIMAEPAHAKARASFMWTATLALNGLTPAGIGEYSFPNHMIEHALSALYNIPHGAGLSIVMPAWMKWYLPKNPGQFARFAKEIFGLDSGEAGIAALEQWFVKLNSPVRLAEMGIAAADIGTIAENAEGLAKQWGIDGLYPKETIAEILRLAV